MPLSLAVHLWTRLGNGSRRFIGPKCLGDDGTYGGAVNAARLAYGDARVRRAQRNRLLMGYGRMVLISYADRRAWVMAGTRMLDLTYADT